MSARWDVIVVGGGPSGSTCARQLVAQGKNVLLIDKQVFPRDKTCAGWVTPAVIRELRIDLTDYAAGNVLQPISGFRIGVIGETKTMEVHYPRVESYGILRCEFDHYLLQRCGADMRLGEAVESIERDGPDWVINKIYRGGLLVGAGGHFCPVARHIGAKLGSEENVIAAKELEFELTAEQVAVCPAQGDVPELYFCADLSGYAWVFRKGPMLNIGLGRDRNRGLTEALQDFIRFLQEMGRIPMDLPQRQKGHAYILYGQSRRPPVADGVLLIGDSLGLAYAQSGEGIRPAVESALMAAEVIANVQGRYSKVDLLAYAGRLAQRFGDPAKHHSIPFLSPSMKRWLAKRLLRSRWFTQKVVLDSWFLHRHLAPLAGVATAATVASAKAPQTLAG